MESFSTKVIGLGLELWLKRLHRRFFLVDFAKGFRPASLQNISGRPSIKDAVKQKANAIKDFISNKDLNFYYMNEKASYKEPIENEKR